MLNPNSISEQWMILDTSIRALNSLQFGDNPGKLIIAPYIKTQDSFKIPRAILSILSGQEPETDWRTLIEIEMIEKNIHQISFRSPQVPTLLFVNWSTVQKFSLNANDHETEQEIFDIMQSLSMIVSDSDHISIYPIIGISNIPVISYIYFALINTLLSYKAEAHSDLKSIDLYLNSVSILENLNTIFNLYASHAPSGHIGIRIAPIVLTIIWNATLATTRTSIYNFKN